MPQEPQSDQDFLKASPTDQHAYLMATDPDYAKASKEEQQAYLQHLAPSAPNAGLAPPAKPPMGAEAAKTMTSGEGPIARGMTSFETQLSKLPGNVYNYLKHPFPTTEETQAEQKKPAWQQVTGALGRLNPVVKIDRGTPNEQVDYGATAANLLPMLVDIRGGGITESPAAMAVRGAGRMVRPNLGPSATNAPISDALHVPVKSPKMQAAITDVEGARPYLKGVRNQAELQTRLPVAKAEVWEPYNKALDIVKDTTVEGPDGPISVGELEAERLKTSADLQAMRKVKPTDRQTQLQQQRDLSDLEARYQKITSAMDPELRSTGISPDAIRRIHGNLKGVERAVSGKSTVTEPMQPFGFGKMVPRMIPNKLGINELNWRPVSGLQDIASGRPLFRGRPTDVATRELFRTAGPKPSFGEPMEPGSAGRADLLRMRLRELGAPPSK